jgi:tyrosyl-tRNA synthetase
MFAKIMAINDDLIDQYFILATNINFEKIKEFETKENPMNAKKELAKIIITELQSAKDAEYAAENFKKTIQNKETPENISLEIVSGGMTACEVMVEAKLASSKSEAKRLIEQNGVKLNDKNITDPNSKIEEGLLSVGKRKFVKIKIK